MIAANGDVNQSMPSEANEISGGARPARQAYRRLVQLAIDRQKPKAASRSSGWTKDAHDAEADRLL